MFCSFRIFFPGVPHFLPPFPHQECVLSFLSRCVLLQPPDQGGGETEQYLEDQHTSRHCHWALQIPAGTPLALTIT